jgi:hypothetical protein
MLEGKHSYLRGSPNEVRTVKYRRHRWADYVLGLKETRNAHSIWMWKPRILLVLEDWNEYNVGVCTGDGIIYSHRQANSVVVISYGREWVRICVILKEC